MEELSGLIKRQNKHLSDLIDRILDINIWEKDQVKLKPEHLFVEEWIRELVEAFLLEKGMSSPTINLEMDIKSDTHLLDQVHMSTVINNLFSNAVKYGISPCKIFVSVSDDDGFLSISVVDNGPGIKKDELKHIFEKFFRGEDSKRKVIKGLGLGLYYVKQIVEAHRGTISVGSVPGKGTRFNIKIPIENGLIAG